ncbi:hypothetical protein [Sphingosinicella sp. BN140058]|uniref:hypothetical protein n=1 Tax=Sphingosinicella sp. BN140058 TaxID=1892855 RepID=UPI00101224C8|nr:hypothetical protein [Sphingosinicella sp. BN140058]QAY78716.1 hypothetical protein ETR14_20855 [Sphingosinicella sp. BN140058]
MRIMTHSAEALLAEAATCRRIAAGMGADPLALSLIEMAEDYEARAAALTPAPMLIAAPDQPA